MENSYAAETEIDKENGKQSFTPSRHLAAAFDWVSTAVMSLTAVAIVFAFLFRVVSVDGMSMSNTLMHGDRLLITTGAYTPHYGDVVVIQRQNDSPLIKRVIGIAGDRIRIDDEAGIVYRNGEPLKEPYVRDLYTPSNGMNEEIYVPKDSVFAMGDNRSNSLDSRMLGTFSLSDVVGKAMFRIAPHPGPVTNGE